MFTSPVITTPTAVFVRKVKTITEAAGLLQNYVDAVLVPRSQKRTDASINTALSAHRRPTDWQTPKQRRWWWAVGIHIWHGRKDKQDWKVKHVRRTNGGAVDASNDMPGARYVFSPPFQQRMHVGVWLTTTVYGKQEALTLSTELADAWHRIASGRGVVRMLT